MATYNNDQFYRIAGADKPLASDNELIADAYSNPPFIWPGPTRQHYSGNGVWSTKNVERGFIRMLTMTKGGTASAEMGKRRCFFQFNPATIVRSVSMRSDMTNVMLQDPSQFSVPVPGDTDFAFEIMFDRSFELNSPPATSSVAIPNSGGTADTLERYGAIGFDALLNASPNEVGVLADLRMLDTIIGQGISEDAIAYILERGEIINSYNTSDTTVDVTTDEDTGETTEESTTTSTSSFDSTAPSWDSATAGKFLARNIGNQAFLIPNPVRVLFSSLFMVDGYIKSVNVQFVKFNEAMVPSQCIIGVQMQALYLGFARKDTYLTYALANAIPQEQVDSTNDPIISDVEGARALADLIDNHLPNFRIAARDEVSTLREDWDDDSTIGDGTHSDEINWTRGIYVDSGSPLPTTVDEGDYFPFYGRIPRIFGEPSVRFYYGFMLPDEWNDDPIKKLGYERSAGFSISYSFSLTIWRHFNDPSLAPYPNPSPSDYIEDPEKPEQYRVTTPNATDLYEPIPTDKVVELFKVSAEHTPLGADEWKEERRVKADLKNESLPSDASNTSDIAKWARMYKIMYPKGTWPDNVGSSSTMRIPMWGNSTLINLSDPAPRIARELKCIMKIEVKGTVGDGAGNFVDFEGSKEVRDLTANTPFKFRVNVSAVRGNL